MNPYKILNTDSLFLINLLFQFMKFIKKLSDGDLTVDGNEVRNKDGSSVDATAESWSSEFTNQQVCVAPSNNIKLRFISLFAVD